MRKSHTEMINNDWTSVKQIMKNQARNVQRATLHVARLDGVKRELKKAARVALPGQHTAELGGGSG